MWFMRQKKKQKKKGGEKLLGVAGAAETSQLKALQQCGKWNAHGIQTDKLQGSCGKSGRKKGKIG